MQDDDDIAPGPTRRRALKTSAGLAAAAAFIGRGVAILPALTVTASAGRSGSDNDEPLPPPTTYLDAPGPGAQEALRAANGMVVTVRVDGDVVRLIKPDGYALIEIILKSRP